MKLQALIERANKTFELGLDKNGMALLYNRMRAAGHATEISEKGTSAAFDAIMKVTDELDVKKQKAPARSVYASLKVEAASPIDGDGCPRCKIQMKQVNLVGGRVASYCEPCHITLPLRIE